MDKRKGIIGGGIAVVLIAGSAWAFGLFHRTDPAIAELQNIGDQMWDRTLPDVQRNQLRDDFRQRIQSLSEDQRRAFFESGREQWMSRSEQRMNEFFAMSPADQQKRLDEIINRAAQSQNNRSQNPARGNNGSRGNRGASTEAQREERSKRRLDQTSAKLRAQYTEFRRRLDDRANQRGVKLPEFPRWGGPGGRSA